MRSRIVRYVIGMIGAFLALVGGVAIVLGPFSIYRLMAGHSGPFATAALWAGMAMLLLPGVVGLMLGIGLLQKALRHNKKWSVKNTQ